MTRYERQKYYYIVTALYVHAVLLVDTVRGMSSVYFPGIVSMVELLRNVLYIGCVLYVCYLFFRYGMDRFDLSFTLITVFVWLLSFMIEPQIADFAAAGMLLFYSRVYVGIILLRHIRNVERFADVLARFMPFTVFYLLTSALQGSSNYMTMSYNLIPIALFNMYYGMKKRKRVWTVAGVSCFFVAGILGSRGAFLGGILSIVLWITAESICGRMPLTAKRVILYLVCFVAVFVFVIAADEIILALSKTFVNSRTLQKILNGTLLDDSGRGRIYERIVEGIRSEPLMPHGLMADRIISSMETPSYLTYPHNLVYEIVYQFGIPLGGCILLWIVGKIARIIRQVPRVNDMQLILMLAFVPTAFIQLMLSNSYLMSWLFGIAMGLLCSKNLPRTLGEKRKRL